MALCVGCGLTRVAGRLVPECKVLHRAQLQALNEQTFPGGQGAQGTVRYDLQYDTVTFAVGATASIATNSITIARDGFYDIGGGQRDDVSNDNIDTQTAFILDVNGAAVIADRDPRVHQQTTHRTVMTPMQLSAGDVIEARWSVWRALGDGPTDPQTLPGDPVNRLFVFERPTSVGDYDDCEHCS